MDDRIPLENVELNCSHFTGSLVKIRKVISISIPPLNFLGMNFSNAQHVKLTFGDESLIVYDHTWNQIIFGVQLFLPLI